MIIIKISGDTSGSSANLATPHKEKNIRYIWVFGQRPDRETYRDLDPYRGCKTLSYVTSLICHGLSPIMNSTITLESPLSRRKFTKTSSDIGKGWKIIPKNLTSGQGLPCHVRARLNTLVPRRKFRFATWNIGSLTGRCRELADVLMRRLQCT